MAAVPEGKVFYSKIAGLLTETIVGKLLLTAGINYGLSALSKSLAGKERAPFPSAAARDVIVQGVLEPQQIIYGEIRTAGHIDFYGTSGASNEFLWYVVSLAHHQCESIGDVWVDNRRIGNSQINAGTGVVSAPEFMSGGASYLSIWKHLGRHDQTVDSNLNSAFVEWTSDHIGAGITYIVIRMQISDQIWPNGNPQSVYAMVKGKRVYDTRKDSTNGGSGSHRYTDATTWEWSNNPALCARDYLTGGSKYFSLATPLNILGLGESNSRINDAYVIAAANSCEEQCALPTLPSFLPASQQVSITRVSSSTINVARINSTHFEFPDYAYDPTPRTNIDITITNVTNGASIGLDSDYAAAINNSGAFNNIDYLFYNNSGTLQIYNEASLNGSFGAITGGTVLRITYDGATVTFYKDGSSIYTASTSGSLYVIGYVAVNAAQFTVASSLSATENRFTCDVQLSADTAHRQNMDTILSAMIGGVSSPSGKIRLHAGVYASPTESLGDDDIQGPMTVITSPTGQDLYNIVNGVFYDEARNWQLAPFPQITQSSYQTDDKGKYPRKVDMPATRGNYRAQRIATVMLKQSRNKVLIQCSQNSLKAARIAQFDTFYLTCAELGYVNQAMRCLEWKLLPTGYPAIIARIESSSAYSDPAISDYIDPARNAPGYKQSQLPFAPTSLTITSFPSTIQFDVGYSATPMPDTITEIWELGSNSPFSSATKIAYGAQSSFTISKNDTTIRYYWVTTRLNGQVSTNFPAGNGTAGNALPALTATSLTATGIAGGIIFSWTASSNQPPGTIWELWEYTSITPFSSATKVWEGGATTYTKLGDTPAAKFYWVRARTNGTEGTEYPSGNGVSGQALAPGAPNGLTLTGFPTYIQLTVTYPATPAATTITELWEYTANTPFSSATKIDEGNKSTFNVPKRDTTTRYYWVRTRLNGQVSATFPAGDGSSSAADLTQTTDIANHGATDISSTTAASVTITTLSHTPDGYSFNDTITTLTYTPPVAVDIEVSVAGQLIYKPNSGLNIVDFFHSIQLTNNAYDTSQKIEVAQSVTDGTTEKYSISNTRRFSVAAGTAWTFSWLAHQFAASDVASVINAEMRLVAIKR